MGFSTIESPSIIKLFRNYFNTDIVLALYPYIYSPLKVNKLRTMQNIILRNFVKNKFFILYVVDLPIHQNLAFNNEQIIDKEAYLLEKKLFENADKICVFNEAMKKTIQEYTAIEDDRFIEFEILDYGVRASPSKESIIGEPIKIAYTGNLDSRFLSNQFSSLPQTEGVNYDFYGQSGEWIGYFNRADLQYHGVLSPEELLKKISSTTHFGLIMRNLNNMRLISYHNLGTTSKFSAYTVAGLPILVPKNYSYISKLVRDYGLGYSFDSLEEIPEIVSRSINSDEYNWIKKNCLDLGDKIQNGFFFKKAINTALNQK